MVFRVAIVVVIIEVSFLFPNLNVVLALGGAVLGFLVTTVMPVMFYNRAYSDDFKHLKHDKRNQFLAEGENEGLLGYSQRDSIEEIVQDYKENELKPKEKKVKDNRKIFKIINYFVLVIGCIIATIGFVGSLEEMITKRNLQK